MVAVLIGGGRLCLLRSARDRPAGRPGGAILSVVQHAAVAQAEEEARQAADLSCQVN